MTTAVSRWGEHGPRPEPLAKNDELFAGVVVHATVDAACSRAEAWSLVADVTRIGEFSPECTGARWLGPDPGPRVGARFEGTNRRMDGTEELLWVRPCTVVVADPGRCFGFVVGDRYDGAPASHWQYDFASLEPATCRIQLTFRHLPGGLSGLRNLADADPEHAEGIVNARIRDLAAGMRTTLIKMATVLEASGLELIQIQHRIE